MKKSALFVLPLLLVVSFSCVSNGKYNELEYQYNRLEEEKNDVEDEYSNLVSKYNTLVEKYNSLLEDYNETVSDNDWNQIVSEDKDRRLNDLLNYVNRQNDRISELDVLLQRIKLICSGKTDDTSNGVNYILRDYR